MQLFVSPNMECVYVALRVGVSPQNFLYQAIVVPETTPAGRYSDPHCSYQRSAFIGIYYFT